VAQAGRPSPNASKLAEHEKRVKEPLEASPLDAITMMGTITQEKGNLRAGQGRREPVPRTARQLHGAELRRHHCDRRFDHQSAGAGSG